MKRRLFIISLILVSMGSGVAAQEKLTIIDIVERYNTSILVNELNSIITLNKSLYFAGEEIYLSAFLKGNAKQRLNTSMFVMNVQILDQTEQIIISEMVKCSKGKLLAQFTLPDWSQSGTYKIRILDSSGEAEIIHKKFSVLSANDIGPVNAEPDIKFYADGGILLAGVENRIIFARNNAESLRIGGWIVSSANDTLQNVQISSEIGSLKVEGMQADRTYFFIDNQSNKYRLPGVVNAGARVIVSAQNERAVNLQAQFFGVENVYFLIGYSAKGVFLSREIVVKAHEGLFFVDVTSDLVPSGWLSFELIEANGEVVSVQEILRPNNLSIEVNMSSDSYAKQAEAKATISIASIPDAVDNLSIVVRKSLDYELSVESPVSLLYNALLDKWAVQGTEAFRTVEGQEILRDLISVTSARQTSLDNTYRGFDLSRSVFVPMDSIELLDENNADINRVDKIILYVLETRDVIVANRRKEGFLIPVHIPFSTQTLYRTNTLAAFGYDKNRDFLGQVSFTVSQENPSPLLTQKDAVNKGDYPQQIQSLIDKQKQKTLIEQSFKQNNENNWTNYEFIKNAPRDVSQKIVPQDFDAFITMEDLVKNIVPYVRVRGQEGKRILQMFEEDTWVKFGATPVVLIDGMPTYNYSIFFNLNPGIIDFIEIINDKDLCREYDLLGKGGVISVQLKAGEINPLVEKEVPLVKVIGLNDTSELENLRFDRVKDNESSPDFRELLYWQPFLRPSAENDIDIIFNTSDETGVFEMEVKGITKNGNIISGFARFKVQAHGIK